MATYLPPIYDMMFVLTRLIGLDGLELDGLGEDDIRLVLESAGALASEVLAPLNAVGDKVGCTLADGKVTTPLGFAAAYAQYREGGWNGVPFAPDHGGQGLPWPVAFAVQEMWQAANMGFGLCPLLNQGAVEAIAAHGTAAQREEYLEKLVSGEWTGTMNLTEPDAGSDLAAIKTKAARGADGSFRITGQKIFITYGEHDFTSNIIHMVLARIDGAPSGTKGISLFIVPKFLADGTRNDVACVSLEHKLGIHASPTCTMQFGEGGGATGYLIGAENGGLKAMFTMMNNARLSVGLQGVAIADRAYQHALAYARGRVQGNGPQGDRVAIVEHADVRRMLLTMRVLVEAGRALAYDAGKALDLAKRGDAAAQDRVDLMTPVVKSWCTDMAQEVTSTALQVFGGMGFIEETGAARFFRDARILPIYEGTNGIQALDLAFRKVTGHGGRALTAWLAWSEREIAALDDAAARAALTEALAALRAGGEMLGALGGAGGTEAVGALAAPFLSLFGYTAGGLALARAAQLGEGEMAVWKKAGSRFYLAQILPRALAAAAALRAGAAAVLEVETARF